MGKQEQAAFSAYRAEVANRIPLDAQEEHRLAERWRAGDHRAGRELVEACLPFVIGIAFEYRRWGIPLEDIVQEGNIGLLKAASRFDPERGCRLATYAAYWIRAEIREYVVRDYRIVRLGSSKSERRALRIYRRTRERDPKVLAQLSGLSEAKVEQLMPLLAARDARLDHAPADGLAPADRLAAPLPTPEEATSAAQEKHRMQRALDRAISELGPRERTIAERRWLTEEPQTLEQLGGDFGVSKERVRQLEERAKKLMRTRVEELTREPALAQSA
jgi:RNA polymerase sigma-32 factor